MPHLGVRYSCLLRSFGAHSFGGMSELTLAEESRARDEGYVVHRGKLIYDVQPPITDAEREIVEAQCVGPIPAELLALWEKTFGGRVDYDLGVELEVGGVTRNYTASFAELFYPESDHYHDLYGWIGHERELLAERRGGRPKLEMLPFGGFEHLERLYVSLRPEDHGSVWIWAQGLPPAWKLQLNEDSVARVADSVDALFDRIRLDGDPFAPAEGEYPNGMEALECIDDDFEAEDPLREKLRAVLRAGMFDWRATVAHYDGSPRAREALVQALRHVAAHDDLALADQLVAQKVPLDLSFQGGQGVLTLALAQGSFSVAARLLRVRRRLGEPVVVAAPGISQELVEELIHRKVPFEAESLISIAEPGGVEEAVFIAQTGKRAGTKKEWKQLRKRLVEVSDQLDDSAIAVDNGELSSNLGADEYRDRAANLRDLARRLRPWWSQIL